MAGTPVCRNARETLRECAENILNCISHMEADSQLATNTNSATQAALATPTAGQQQQMPLNSRNTGQQQRTAVSTPAAENARAELGRLFNFTPAGIPRKRKLPTGIKLPNTWTHTFICLGRMRDNEVPSNGYKTQLSNASLGEKKITFEKKSSCNYFHEKLLESYPKLKEGGGYELMRTKFRSTSKLEILQPKGNAGHNVLDLKEMVASARIYVRPLQNDLSLEQIEHASLSSDTGPLEMCVKCGIRIQLSTMRQHMQDCGGGSVASTSSVYDPDMLDFSGTSQVTTIVNDDSSDEDKDPVPIKTGCQQKSAVSPTALADLQRIFPVKSSSALQSALDIGGSLEQAIDLLLETGSNAGDRDGSSTETGMPSVCTQPRTAVEIMQSYRCQTEQGTAYIDVNRMQLSMLRQIMTIYKNPQLNLKKHVNVNFHGEQGADLGGPSKEFFHSAISSLSKVDPVFNMQLFGGQDGHLIPFYGVDAVSSGCFQVAGKLVAHSLKNDGPGFVGLSPAVVKYLNTGSLEEAAVFVTMDDLTDLELKGLLQEKILQKKNIDEVDGEAKDKVEELLVRHGLTEAVPLSDLNKDKAMNDLLVAEVLVTRTVALDSFFHGLNSLGLGDLLRKHPSITEFVFPSIEEASVDMDILKSKLLQANPIQEIVGEAQAQSWEWFLEYVNNSSSDVDDNTGYPLSNSLVMFITGTTVLDPQENLEVTFQTDTTKKLLEADSCFRKLILPISHGCYEEFKAACNLSLLSGAVGYGRF